jgi:hypothetical protein
MSYVIRKTKHLESVCFAAVFPQFFPFWCVDAVYVRPTFGSAITDEVDVPKA